MKRRPVVEVEVAWRPESPNLTKRDAHWGIGAKRNKQAASAWEAAVHGVEAPPVPVIVELVRVSFSRLDDDNLRGSLKAIRDLVATWLGCRNDRDPRVRWAYAQGHTNEREIDPKTGGTRCRCFAVVRVWLDPKNDAPPPKPPRASRAKPPTAHALEVAMLSRIRALLEANSEVIWTDCLSDEADDEATFERLVRAGSLRIVEEPEGERRVVEVLEPESARALPTSNGGLRHGPPSGGWPADRVKAAIKRGESLEEVQTLAKSLGMPPILVSCAKIDWEQHNRPKPPEPVCAAPELAPPPRLPDAPFEGGPAYVVNDNPSMRSPLRLWDGSRACDDDPFGRHYERLQRGHDAIFRVHASREDADAIIAKLQRDGLEAWWDPRFELVRVACPSARLDTLCAGAQAAGYRVDVSVRPK